MGIAFDLFSFGTLSPRHDERMSCGQGQKSEEIS